MQPFYSTLTALVVTTIYVLWQRLYEDPIRRDRAVQERVTYMLWKMACQVH